MRDGKRFSYFFLSKFQPRYTFFSFFDGVFLKQIREGVSPKIGIGVGEGRPKKCGSIVRGECWAQMWVNGGGVTTKIGIDDNMGVARSIPAAGIK
jgi:hypothetical protein